MCRSQGGLSDSDNWSPRVGAVAGHDCWAVPSVDLHDGSEGSGLVPAGQGGVDHASGQGGSREEDGGNAAGGGDEEGEESPVDGVSVRPWVGTEWKLSLLGVNLSSKDLICCS